MAYPTTVKICYWWFHIDIRKTTTTTTTTTKKKVCWSKSDYRWQTSQQQRNNAAPTLHLLRSSFQLLPWDFGAPIAIRSRFCCWTIVKQWHKPPIISCLLPKNTVNWCKLGNVDRFVVPAFQHFVNSEMPVLLLEFEQVNFPHRIFRAIHCYWRSTEQEKHVRFKNMISV